MGTKLGPVLVLFLLLVAAPNAGAVWGGHVDVAHPQVGAMYFDGNDDGSVTADEGGCSGSYAGRSKDGDADVFLTAGHCIPPPELRSDVPAGALLRFVRRRCDRRRGRSSSVSS